MMAPDEGEALHLDVDLVLGRQVVQHRLHGWVRSFDLLQELPQGLLIGLRHRRQGVKRQHQLVGLLLGEVQHEDGNLLVRIERLA
jgi:hypothetical protein